jgi:L-lactate dehydrogenase (cytochrome)
MSTIGQDFTHPATAASKDARVRSDAAPRIDKTLPRSLRGILALQDLEEPARRYLPRPIFGYVSGATETNASLRGNRSAYEDLSFVPQALVDVSARSTKTTLFDRSYDAPFGVSPMGGTSMVAYEGDVVLARVAQETNIPMIMSGASLTRLEDVRAAGRTAWFQAYLPGEDDRIQQLVERVARAGFDTLVLTVDTPVGANRENNVRSGFHKPMRPTPRLAWDCLTHPRWFVGMLMRTVLNHGMPYFENMGERVPLIARSVERDRGNRDELSWRHVELMRRLWKGRLVLKGVLSKATARIARESGVDGIIVSNHGGRQLDYATAPLRVLPGIAAQAGGMTVMMDGGIRRGTDILKALALGAQFVFVGRPMLYATAIGGDVGLRHVIKLLREEVDRDMALLGITATGQMRRELLMDARGFDGLTGLASSEGR